MRDQMLCWAFYHLQESSSDEVQRSGSYSYCTFSCVVFLPLFFASTLLLTGLYSRPPSSVGVTPGNEVSIWFCSPLLKEKGETYLRFNHLTWGFQLFWVSSPGKQIGYCLWICDCLWGLIKISGFLPCPLLLTVLGSCRWCLLLMICLPSMTSHMMSWCKLFLRFVIHHPQKIGVLKIKFCWNLHKIEWQGNSFLSMLHMSVVVLARTQFSLLLCLAHTASLDCCMFLSNLVSVMLWGIYLNAHQ